MLDAQTVERNWRTIIYIIYGCHYALSPIPLTLPPPENDLNDIFSTLVDNEKSYKHVKCSLLVINIARQECTFNFQLLKVLPLGLQV